MHLSVAFHQAEEPPGLSRGSIRGCHGHLAEGTTSGLETEGLFFFSKVFQFARRTGKNGKTFKQSFAGEVPPNHRDVQQGAFPFA